jgi:hypothetical protein
MPRLNAPCAAALVLLTAGSAQAKDLFDLAVTVGSGTAVQSGETSASTITDIINQLQTQNLNNLVSSYSEISAATATPNIRGVTAFASYPANSTALRFQVPAAGVDETFTGATRNNSENQLKDFLLKNGGGMATRLLQEMVAASPIDPVAGNPNSLENVSARNDFTIGTGIGISGFEIPGHGPAGGLLGQPNLVSLGGDVGVANSGGYTSTVVTLPLRYTIPFRDPRYALTFDLPITYVSTQGAASYFGSFGVSLRIPVPAIDNWYITPSIRTGAAGSIAVGAAAL